MKKLFKMFVIFLVLVYSPDIFAQVSFSGPTDFTLGAGASSLTHADINGDGKQDIIAARNWISQTVAVLINTTAIGATPPTFSAATNFTIGGSSQHVIAIADLNSDGKLDIIASASNGDIVSVLLNTTPDGASTPSFSSYTSFPVGAADWSVAIGDVNGDGKPDIVTANFDANSVSVLLNTTTNGASTPSFSSKTDFTVGSSPSSVSIGDVNGDGKPDIVTANYSGNTASVLLNTTSNGASTPTFTITTDFAVGGTTYSVILDDVNGDGKPDIVTANFTANSVSVLLNTTAIGASTPTFSGRTDFGVGTSPYCVAIADFDGDGKSDVVTANSGTNNVSVLINTTTIGASTPTFSSNSDFAVGTNPRSVTTADINGDNKPDIITSNTTASVLLNTTSFPSAIVWDGSESSNWNVGANWSTNGVPTASDNVTIPNVATNDPIISSAPAVCNNLTISWGGSLTINASQSLTVSGTMTNNAGTSGLVIQSSASGTGSLIHNTFNVNATIQRYITGSSTLANMMYHFVSVPLTPVTSSLSNLFLASYLYNWSETTNAWVHMGTPTTTALGETRGFMIYYPGASITYSFAGSMNNGSFTALTTYTASSGYNLVPNPYPSAIDWDAAGWTKTGIANATYIWYPGGSSGTSNYASYVGGVGANNGTKYIPVGQAFFVLATSAPVLSMTNSVRVHSTQPFWKDGEVIPDLLRIKTVALQNNAFDEIVVHFRDGATTEFDSEFDANKLQGGADAPQLSSVASDNSELSINSLPLSTGSVVVPLNFSFSSASEVTFTASSIESFDNNVSLYLEDKALSKMVNLRQEPVYTFSYQPGSAIDRFQLHFAGINGIGQLVASSGKAFVSNGHIYIEVPDMEGSSADISVYNSMGQLIRSEHQQMNGIVSIAAPQSTGIFIVLVTSSDHHFVTKVFNK